MFAIDTVLLPTDLSHESDGMLRFAEGLTGAGVSRVIVGHIAGPAGQVEASVREEAQRRLDERVARLRDAGMQVEVRVAEGDPTVALLQMAKDARADAVFVGSHGKSVDERLSAGSVSEALAMGAHLPVALARFAVLDGGDTAANMASGMGNVILVPTDFSASAARAIDVAVELAKRTKGLLRLMTVVSDEKRPTPALQDLRERCCARGARTSKVVVRAGDPATEILAEAKECGATSVMMGTRGRSPVGEALLGSISLSVARSITCPVVIVP